MPTSCHSASRGAFAARDERVGRDDRLRRGEVVAPQDVGRPDSLFGVDELPAEQDEVLGDKRVDEGLVVDVDLAEPRALEQSHEDVHSRWCPTRRCSVEACSRS